MTKELERVYKAPPGYNPEDSTIELVLKALKKEKQDDLDSYNWRFDERGWMGWYIVGILKEPVEEPVEDLQTMYAFYDNDTDRTIVFVDTDESVAFDRAQIEFEPSENVVIVAMSPLSEVMEV